MRGSFRRTAALAAATVLAGAVAACATGPTPYQPYVAELGRGVHGGYSEQQIGPDRYIVRFHGNEFTSRDRVEGYLLYRAAQLALEKGFDTFVMIDRHTEHDVQTYVRPDPFYDPWYGPGYGYWHPDWRYYVPGAGWYGWHPGSGRFWRDRPDIVRVEAFEASAEIALRRGPPPADEPRAFDAHKVIAELGPSIQLPKS
jgi:hypothetical protein